MLNIADSFADKNERWRRVVYSAAADKHNEYVRECLRDNVELSVEDGEAIWNGCLRWAAIEYRFRLI